MKYLLIFFLMAVASNTWSQQQYDSIISTGAQDHMVYNCNGKPCNGIGYTHTLTGKVATFGNFSNGIVQGELKNYNSNGVINEVDVFNKEGKLINSTYYNDCARVTRTIDWVAGTFVDYFYDPTTYEYLIKETGVLGTPGKSKKFIWSKKRWVRN